MPDDAPTNMRVLEPSRKAVREGDVFTYVMPDGKHRFGRVISTEAEIGPITACQLLYFFDPATASEDPPLSQLRPDSLLIPPCMTNRLGWRRGRFKTVWRGPVPAQARLPQHCFWDSTRKKYFDEKTNELPGPVEPVGRWGLVSYRRIDDDLSRALGFDPVPE